MNSGSQTAPGSTRHPPRPVFVTTRWTMALLEQTMSRLRSEFDRAGKMAEFDRLKTFLTAERRDIPCATAAGENVEEELKYLRTVLM